LDVHQSFFFDWSEQALKKIQCNLPLPLPLPLPCGAAMAARVGA
jgi:hypothetical protein